MSLESLEVGDLITPSVQNSIDPPVIILCVKVIKEYNHKHYLGLYNFLVIHAEESGISRNWKPGKIKEFYGIHKRDWKKL